jgi:monooxygenase
MTMTASTTDPAQGPEEIQDAGHFDVLIVGAGVSGIGAAHHLREQFPDRSFAILDAQESRGGTWWTHRYPGVRSDSDLFTYGYRFKPWRGPSIAAGEEILAYLDEVIDEDNLSQCIRYRHLVTAASWSTDDRRWTVEVTRGDSGQQLRFTTGFLWMCQGYYNHAKPYQPKWEGMDRFQGLIVHPQRWPEGLDLAGKRIVVIGSGATAATLIPAIAEKAEHVTMLQRSPSYFYAPPTTHELAITLRALDIPEEWTHEILRRQYIAQTDLLARTARETPEELHTLLVESMRPLLPEGFDIDKHFTPRYRPWQQRIAIVPDGDLFTALREGTASIVTDIIETFTEHGITVQSGEQIAADIVVTATGFNMSVLGDVAFTVDGQQVDFTERVTWRGIMINGLPNMAYVFGYFRHSWTLRVDLVSDLVGRLLVHMQDKGATMVVPTLRPQDADMQLRAWSDPENFNAGYVMRSQHILFKQGDSEPWTHMLEHEQEREILPAVDLDDGTLVYRCSGRFLLMPWARQVACRCGGWRAPERLCRQGCEPGEASDDAGALEEPAEVDEPARLTETGAGQKHAREHGNGAAAAVKSEAVLAGPPGPPAAGECGGRQADEHGDSRQIVHGASTAGLSERVGRSRRVAADRISSEDGRSDKPRACGADQRRCYAAAGYGLTGARQACSSSQEQRSCHGEVPGLDPAAGSERERTDGVAQRAVAVAQCTLE